MAVREWFAGQEILLTGVTSDIGNAVLEKLLRTCTGIKTIHVILRVKDGLRTEARMKKMFASPGFERVRQECPEAMSRLNLLNGNLMYEDVGLSEKQISLLSNVSVVIHSGGPYDTLFEFCQALPSLRVAVATQSVFKHGGRISESLQQEKLPEIPLALVRIPAVGPALKEPMPGYVNNLNGATALMVGAGYALGNTDFPAAILPVDLAANTLITSAWDKGMRINTEERTVTVYNVPALDCTWKALIDGGRRAGKKFPYPSFGIRGMTSSPWCHWLVVLLLEWLPSVLCDTFLFAVGGKPRIVEEHNRIRAMLNTLEPLLSKPLVTDRKTVYELNDKLSPEDQEDFYIRTPVDLEAYVLCSAATVKRMCVDDKNSKIIMNFKRLLVSVIALVSLYVLFFLYASQ